MARLSEEMNVYRGYFDIVQNKTYVDVCLSPKSYRKAGIRGKIRELCDLRRAE